MRRLAGCRSLLFDGSVLGEIPLHYAGGLIGQLLFRLVILLFLLGYSIEISLHLGFGLIPIFSLVLSPKLKLLVLGHF